MTVINFKLSFAGEFKFVLTRNDGSTFETEWMKNIITNIGLDKIGIAGMSDSTFIAGVLRLGTGTSTPSVTNTQLDNQIVWTGRATTANSIDLANAKCSTTHTYRFNKGSVIGNITEMGVGWDTTGNTLWSRSLITDSNGNPTSINVTSIDQLTVFYRCNMIVPTNTITGSLNISGVEYTYTGRIANFNQWSSFSSVPNYSIVRISGSYPSAGGNNSTLGPTSGSISNSQSTQWLPVENGGPYISGTYYLDQVFVVPDWAFNFSVGTPPVVGIKTIRFDIDARLAYQFEFNPIIPKDNTKTVKITFRFSWGRV